MPILEVFFDYACPYCLRGHEYLTELLLQYPNLEIDWHPCEAHPRPETYGPHSDLCARGMYFALECGADLREYHRRMYKAALDDHSVIESARVIAETTDGLLDGDVFERILSGDQFKDKLRENNRLAWNVYGFPAVPSYRIDGQTLKSIPGIGVSKAQLAAFLDEHVETVN